MKTLKLLVEICFIALCCIGFGFQVTSLTKGYFRFETIRVTTADILKYTYAPDLHVCPYADKLFDFRAYNRNSATPFPVGVTAEERERTFRETITVKDLFTYTPSAESLISKCLIRAPGSELIDTYNVSTCYEILKVTKYYRMSYMCYKIKLVQTKGDPMYDFDNLAYAVDFSGIYYWLELPDQWSRFLTMFRVMSVEQGTGDNSLVIAPYIVRNIQNGSTPINIIMVAHSKITYRRLPAPYDTNCQDYRREHLGNAMRNHMISGLFLATCSIGFLYQSYNLTSTYLQFETTTLSTADIPQLTYAPNVHLCPFAYQVFNIEKYNKEASHPLPVNIASFEEKNPFDDTFTISELLKYTPSAESMIDGCVIRKPGPLGFDELNRTKCYERFKLEKYYKFSFMCYKAYLSPETNDVMHDFNDIAYSQVYPGMYYSLILNDQWSRLVGNAKVISYEERHGDKSFAVAPIVDRHLEDDCTKHNFIWVSHSKIRYHRLPPPYDSKCRDYVADGLGNAVGCINACMYKRSLEHLDRIWYASRSRYPIDKRPLSFLDVKHNGTKRAILKKLDRECKGKCQQTECNITWSLTRAIVAPFSKGLTIQVMISVEASFAIDLQPKLMFGSYLIYLMSVFGSWFGLSVLSFNPIKLFSQVVPMVAKPSHPYMYRSHSVAIRGYWTFSQ
ncbi:hypothetical protein HDE_01908 [Halotydeus destructor]|nr:hypothetical protein HDE_01908 [Halotydeus destructor]